MEVDVAETKDGKLVLMHDDDLERTTTGTGLVADHTLAEIQALKLETGSKVTDFSPPTLEAALDWAVKNDAILELDKKRAADLPADDRRGPRREGREQRDRHHVYRRAGGRGPHPRARTDDHRHREQRWRSSTTWLRAG